jgi:hypothetical protein
VRRSCREFMSGAFKCWHTRQQRVARGQTEALAQVIGIRPTDRRNSNTAAFNQPIRARYCNLPLHEPLSLVLHTTTSTLLGETRSVSPRPSLPSQYLLGGMLHSFMTVLDSHIRPTAGDDKSFHEQSNRVGTADKPSIDRGTKQ